MKIRAAQGYSGEVFHDPGFDLARLLRRVFNIDLEYCPLCSGTLKIIAAIEEPTVITKILGHLGLPTSHLRYAFPASLAVRPSLIATLSMLRSKSRATLLVARS
ncbi:MAG: hypothetical protein L0Y39_05815 [Methylococcaceae bacterium]|nr:hypothetical protein [Methylococcaceae bacterium]MCI0667415.1 hypothetical protein [Methylococcaceae bacterium]